MTPSIQPLPWDTEFFGFSVARWLQDNPTDMEIEQADAWCEREGVRCLYALIPASNPRAVQRLAAAGYRWVDIRVTLRASPPPTVAAIPTAVRAARSEDVAALRAIAAVSHRDGRFYSDPCFPRERCDAFYAEWIENSTKGFEDAVFVADLGQGPVGYVTCKRKESSLGQIGLFAVADQARGKGLGRELLAAAYAWFRAEECACVDVVTQGANVDAQRIYQRNGFVTHGVGVWLHKWYLKS